MVVYRKPCKRVYPASRTAWFGLPLEAVFTLPLKAFFKWPRKALFKLPLKALSTWPLEALFKLPLKAPLPRLGFALVCVFACLAVSACGWHLRGMDRGARPQALDLVVENRFEPLVLAVRDVMRQNGIDIDESTPLQLHLGKIELERRTVAVTSIGSASQYELNLRVAYRYHLEGGQAQPMRLLSANRVFDFDPTNTVAKNEEENTLLDEMRRELALRMLDSVPLKYGQDQP